MKPSLTNTVYLLLKVGIKLFVFRLKFHLKELDCFQVERQATEMLFVITDNFGRISESINS